MIPLADTANFWASSTALIGIGVVAGLIILLWDWRISFAGLALVQFGLGQVLVYRYGVPAQWPAIYFWVVLASSLIITLAPLQMGVFSPFDRSGNLLFRGMLLLLLAAVVFSLPMRLPLPLLDPETLTLFFWLFACSLLVLSLTDEAVHAGLGMFLWLVPVQSLLAILLPLPSLIAVLGAMNLLVALACSYLALAENQALAEQQRPLTEIVFPARVAPPAVAPAEVPQVFRRWLSRRLTLLSASIKRVLH